MKLLRSSVRLAALLAFFSTAAHATVPIGPADVVATEGDSIVSQPYRYQIQRPAIQQIQATISPHVMPPAVWPPPAVITSPSWPPAPVITSRAWPPAPPAGASSEPGGPVTYNRAVPGSLSADVARRIGAEIAANPHITVWILNVGVNDVFLKIPLAKTLANMTTILNAIQASGVTKVIVSGVFAIGEKYPSGQNDAGFDPAIDAMDAAVASLVATYPGNVYVSQRQLVYGLLEPQLNTAAKGYADPNGLTHGPLTLGSDPNALHPVGNQVGGGSWYCSQALLSKITILPMNP